jgi:hypothetical protein
MQFVIVRDLEWGEDGEVVTLRDITGKEIMQGDWYHDKIDSKIEGFFECLDFIGTDYEKETVIIND